MSDLYLPEIDEDLDGGGLALDVDAVCRSCGCSDDDACETEAGRCFWIEADLCSACAR